MLKICREYAQLDRDQVLCIYADSLKKETENGIDRFTAEENFLDYLRDDFFVQEDAMYAIWIENDQYVSALRVEREENGFLISGVETSLHNRRKGYAAMLLCAVINYASKMGFLPLYAHIHKKNTPSMLLHRKCGFIKKYDFGKLIDGTVSNVYETFVFPK